MKSGSPKRQPHNRDAVLKITFADGWEYSAPVGSARPKRLDRILQRLRDPRATVESVLCDMPPAERQWIRKYAAARFAYEKEQKAAEAKAKVEAWKAENGGA